MKTLLSLCLIIFAVIFNSQAQTTTYRLDVASDSSTYSFSYISPIKQHFTGKLPEDEFKYYSLSRSIRLESLDKNLALLIGRNNLDQQLVIFDENVNNDLSDDPVHYFNDTISSPTRGNYKHLKINTTISGKVREVSFDYSIIKPKALSISFGDSLEDKIHFMIRPHQYRYTILKTDSSSFKMVLFSKTPYDFSKKSTYAVVIPADRVGFKTTDKFANRYVVGDVILAGNEKFIFQGISAGGDSVTLSKLKDQAMPVGGKVGFKSNNYLGTDIRSGDSIRMENLKGKYVLLDFWGTWCAPCIKILEDIRKLHLSLDSNKVKMIGVCYDNDLQKVKEFMDKRGIDWTQLFDLQKQSVLAGMFEISAYPSFVLIDTDGKIIYKEEGLDGFQRISEKLKEITGK